MKIKTLNVAQEFSRFPSGRYLSDSRFSGERFRDEFLLPLLQEFDVIEIELDGTLGYGSSFLDEAFGDIARNNTLSTNEIKNRLVIKTSNPFLKSEIHGYLGI